MYRFIESIRVENREMDLVSLHQERMERTFRHFRSECNISISHVFENLKHDKSGLYKLRIEYDLANNYIVEIIPYTAHKIDNLGLTISNDIDYSLKYADRSALLRLKDESPYDEIIIVKHGQITDTSFSNLLFLKGDTWFTPFHYLLNGVMRQHLLSTNRVKETEITLDNIHDFTHFKLINALRNFEDSAVHPINQIKNLP